MKKTYLNKTTSALKTMFAAMLVFAAVSGKAQCNANFTYTLGPNGWVNFKGTTNTSSLSPAPFYTWNFGNGSSANGILASTTYTTNGYKIVCLTVSDTIMNCSNTKCDTLWITNVPTNSTTPCPNSVVYTMSKDSSVALTWNAFPTYPLNITSATWSWGDGTTSTGLYPSHTYSAAGTYSTCVTVSVACNSLTATYCYVASIFKSTDASGNNAMIKMNVVSSKPTGISSLKQDNNLLVVYPNPNNGLFTIDLSGLTKNSKELNVSVYNMLGELVIEKNNVSATSQTIDASGLSNGSYFVKVLSDTGLYTKKIMVQK